MVFINGNISGNKFTKMMKYLYSISDKITFFVSDFSMIMEKREQIDFNKFLENNKLKKSFVEYIQEIESKIPAMINNTTRKYFNSEYIHTISDRLMLIYEVNFTKEVLDELLHVSDDLYSFKYLGLPEDLCFYTDETLLISTVSHEKECIIEHEDDKIIKDLVELNVFKNQDFIVWD